MAAPGRSWQRRCAQPARRGLTPSIAIEALVQEADGGWRSLLDSAIRHVYVRVNVGFPYVGTDFVVPRAESRLVWVQRAAIVAGYTALGALAYARTAPGPARAVVAVYLMAALVGMPLLNLWVASLRVAAGSGNREDIAEAATAYAVSPLAPGRPP